jgi:WD40 repeat protein
LAPSLRTDGLWTLQYENERDILISGSRDTTVKVWNMKNFTCEQTLTGHTGALPPPHHSVITQNLMT